MRRGPEVRGRSRPCLRALVGPEPDGTAGCGNTWPGSESFLPRASHRGSREQEGNDEQAQDAGTDGTGSRDGRHRRTRRRALGIGGDGQLLQDPPAGDHLPKRLRLVEGDWLRPVDCGGGVEGERTGIQEGVLHMRGLLIPLFDPGAARTSTSSC